MTQANLRNNHTSNNTQRKILRGNAHRDNSFTRFDNNVGLMSLTFGINTSTSVVLPPTSPLQDTSVTREEKLHDHSLGDALVEFAEALMRRSRSLSAEDSKLYEKIIQSKLEPIDFDF